MQRCRAKWSSQSQAALVRRRSPSAAAHAEQSQRRLQRSRRADVTDLAVAAKHNTACKLMLSPALSLAVLINVSHMEPVLHRSMLAHRLLRSAWGR